MITAKFGEDNLFWEFYGRLKLIVKTGEGAGNGSGGFQSFMDNQAGKMPGRSGEVGTFENTESGGI